MKKVLFLCTGNSARSQMAEAIMNHIGREKYQAFSAGSNPNDQINPYALSTIESSGLKTENLKVKHMMDFADEEFDFLITLCDKMKENCPVFPNKPIYAHWGMPDPAEFQGSETEIESFFKKTFQEISNRIQLMLCLDVDRKSRTEIEKELGDIANTWKYIR